MVIASALLGISVQNRRALLASLQERAARLELERDQQGRLAAAAERARIAREMHDIVAHNLTVVIALADGAVFAARESPEQATAAMEKVSRTGREALAEMRRLLGVLNDERRRLCGSPQPGISELNQLVDQVRTTGVPVDLEIEGDPAGLPAGVQLATYRIVQEALTNTLKHAGPDADGRRARAVRERQCRRRRPRRRHRAGRPGRERPWPGRDAPASGGVRRDGRRRAGPGRRLAACRRG